MLAHSSADFVNLAIGGSYTGEVFKNDSLAFGANDIEPHGLFTKMHDYRGH